MPRTVIYRIGSEDSSDIDAISFLEVNDATNIRKQVIGPRISIFFDHEDFDEELYSLICVATVRWKHKSSKNSR